MDISNNFADMVKNNLNDSDSNYFTLDNPSNDLIIVIITRWLNRKFKTNRCILRLEIENCKFDRKTVALIF